MIKEVRSHRLWRSRQPAVVRYRQRADGLADQAARSLNFTMRIVLQSAPMASLFCASAERQPHPCIFCRRTGPQAEIRRAGLRGILAPTGVSETNSFVYEPTNFVRRPFESIIVKTLRRVEPKLYNRAVVGLAVREVIDAYQYASEPSRHGLLSIA